MGKLHGWQQMRQSYDFYGNNGNFMGKLGNGLVLLWEKKLANHNFGKFFTCKNCQNKKTINLWLLTNGKSRVKVWWPDEVWV